MILLCKHENKLVTAISINYAGHPVYINFKQTTRTMTDGYWQCKLYGYPDLNGMRQHWCQDRCVTVEIPFE